MTGGGTTTIEVTARRPGRPGVHQPQRHPDELLRRPHAVGQLDHAARRRSTARMSAPTSPAHPNGTLQQRHGFIFEVPAGGQSNRQPITSAGRFAHEAAAYSPDEGIVYLTEDNFAFPSGLYRTCRRRNPMRQAAWSTAACSRCCGSKGTRTPTSKATRSTAPLLRRLGRHRRPRPTFPYTPGQPAPTTNNAALTYVGDQGRAQGAAHFSRLEGATFDNGGSTSPPPREAARRRPARPIAAATATAPARSGPTTRSRQKLSCVYQSPGPDDARLPGQHHRRSDRGTIVLCEDGPRQLHPRPDRTASCSTSPSTGCNSDGTPRFDDEFAGATFSPDGETLFVNIQAAGMTFAIWGPWGRLGV